MLEVTLVKLAEVDARVAGVVSIASAVVTSSFVCAAEASDGSPLVNTLA